MNISIPTADLQAAFSAAVQNALASEIQLGNTSKAQIESLVTAMYPSLTSLTQELIDSKNPSVQQGYLAILDGIVVAKTAQLGLAALATQRQVIAGALSTAVNILGMLLKAAVAAA